MVWAMSLATSLSLAQSVNCPSHGEISPCSCTLKKSGLDIVCEYTDILHISEVMSKLKGRTNAVIFYLRLRHNNLPKLQPYVFLGLDIRHLTIHNSSLSKLEESSLSSIGEYSSLLRSLPNVRLYRPFDNVSPLLFFSLFSNRPTEKRFNSTATSTAFSFVSFLRYLRLGCRKVAWNGFTARSDPVNSSNDTPLLVFAPVSLRLSRDICASRSLNVLRILSYLRFGIFLPLGVFFFSSFFKYLSILRKRERCIAKAVEIPRILTLDT